MVIVSWGRDKKNTSSGLTYFSHSKNLAFLTFTPKIPTIGEMELQIPKNKKAELQTPLRQ
jgi:hypothetical protein